MGLKRTHFFAFHEAHGHLVDFAGFAMPLYYEGITAEHLAVRDHVGLFDVSHMGRALVSGPEAGRFLDYVTTRTPSALTPLRGHYTVMCNDRGGIVDDVTVFRLEEDQFFVVYNAGNRDKDYQWLITHRAGCHIRIEDRSDQTPMIALQGPHAAATLQRLTSTDVQRLRRQRPDDGAAARQAALLVDEDDVLGQEVGQFQVAGDGFPEPHGVEANPLAAGRLGRQHRVQTPVVLAVGEQHHGGEAPALEGFE